MQQQQQQPGFGASLGAIKGEPGGLKADPGVKLEGVMAEPSFKPDPGLKQVRRCVWHRCRLALLPGRK